MHWGQELTGVSLSWSKVLTPAIGMPKTPM